MNTQPLQSENTKSQFLFDFSSRLKKNGLPNQYVERMTREIDDHLSDLEEANERIEKIGEMETLVSSTVQNYRSQTFAGKHPVWATLIAGTFLIPVVWIVYNLLLILIISTIVESTSASPEVAVSESLRFVLHSLHFSGFIVPFLVVGFLGNQLASQCGRGYRTAIIICVMQCLWAIPCGSSLHISSGLLNDSNSYSIGFETSNLVLSAEQFAKMSALLLISSLLLYQTFLQSPKRSEFQTV